MNMALLQVIKKFCFITSENNSLLLKCEYNKWNKCDQFNKVFESFKDTTKSKDYPDINISCFAFSNCESYLAFCTNNKYLLLINLEKCELISHRQIARSSSSVKFTPKGEQIVQCDKSGDVYAFSVKNFSEPGELILGHLSMLLDILPTPDEKYLITCDRDDKIRVSHFPNSYNIETYCLGHTEFVSSITFLAHNNEILVSTSGDGTVKFWNYLKSQCLYSLDCSNYILENHQESLTDREANDIDQDTKILPVRFYRNIQLTPESSLACISLSTFKGLLIYTIKYENSNFSSQLNQTLIFEEELYDYFLNAKNLWTLLPSEIEPLKIYIFKNNKFYEEHDEISTSALDNVSKEKTLFSPYKPPSSYSYLYKQKFDNIEEYHKRKNLRISNQINSKKLKSS